MRHGRVLHWIFRRVSGRPDQRRWQLVRQRSHVRQRLLHFARSAVPAGIHRLHLVPIRMRGVQRQLLPADVPESHLSQPVPHPPAALHRRHQLRLRRTMRKRRVQVGLVADHLPQPVQGQPPDLDSRHHHRGHHCAAHPLGHCAPMLLLFEATARRRRCQGLESVPRAKHGLRPWLCLQSRRHTAKHRKWLARTQRLCAASRTSTARTRVVSSFPSLGMGRSRSLQRPAPPSTALDTRIHPRACRLLHLSRTLLSLVAPPLYFPHLS